MYTLCVTHGFFNNAQNGALAQMALSISKYRKQAKREVEGVWRDYEGCKLLIAYIDNPAYRDKVRELSRQYINDLQKGGDMAVAAIKKIRTQATAEHILLGWEDVTDESGTNVPYTVAQVIAYFDDSDFGSKFFQDVVVLANEQKNFTDDVTEQALKN